MTTTSAPRDRLGDVAGGLDAVEALAPSRGERFQARTSWPAAARLRAIGAPMIPVPRTATRMLASYPFTRKLPRMNGWIRQK